MHLAFGGWMQAASTLGGLAAAIGHGPMAVGLDPALHRLFRKLWRVVVQEVSAGFGGSVHSQHLGHFVHYRGRSPSCRRPLQC